MILAPQPPNFEAHYRPSYVEIANDHVSEQYRNTDKELVASREGSDFLRRMIAMVYASQKLDKLCMLRNNWNSFDSEKPAIATIQAAFQVVNVLVALDLIPDAILPSAEGGVAICFVRHGKYADVECLNSGEILAVTSTRGEKPHAWALDPNSITAAALENFSAYLWS
jgi:hypothetical protein